MRYFMVILVMAITALNATTFSCSDNQRNLYAKIWQSSDQNEMTLYNDKGNQVDHLYIGKAKAGNPRYYGQRTTIYVYQNRRQFSIRSYDSARNVTGPIFGVFNCRVR